MNYKKIILFINTELYPQSLWEDTLISNQCNLDSCSKIYCESTKKIINNIHKYSSLPISKLLIIVDSRTNLNSIFSNLKATNNIIESPFNTFDQPTMYYRINYQHHLIGIEPHQELPITLKKNIDKYLTINNDATALTLSKLIGEKLSALNLNISSAESCTGGLIAKRFTDISGSSHYFNGGICTYTAQAKSQILNVPMTTIQKYGIVSPQTAQAMAQGAQALFHSAVSIATTGVAGPGPDDDDNPEGRVYIAISIKKMHHTYKYDAFDHSYFLDRDSIRNGCVVFCFEKLLDLLNSAPQTNLK